MYTHFNRTCVFVYINIRTVREERREKGEKKRITSTKYV